MVDDVFRCLIQRGRLRWRHTRGFERVALSYSKCATEMFDDDVERDGRVDRYGHRGPFEWKLFGVDVHGRDNGHRRPSKDDRYALMKSRAPRRVLPSGWSSSTVEC